jgi:hypothetical protein
MDMTDEATLSPGRRTTIRVVIVVAAALLCLGTLGGLTAAAIGLGNTRVIADSADLPGALRTLEIDAGDLPMAIRITSDPDASAPRTDLRLVSSTGSGRHRMDVTTDGGSARVSVSGEPPEWLRWAWAGELTVVLPPGMARGVSVTTTQRFGLAMFDADLDRVVAHNDSGAVLLRGAARSIEAHNQHGAVYSRRPLAVQETFTAVSVDGDITVDFQDPAPTRIEATSDGGDVVLGLAGDGPYLVNASTSTGRGDTVVRVPQTIDPQRAAATVIARSATADVTVDQRG